MFSLFFNTAAIATVVLLLAHAFGEMGLGSKR
jgi:hypothetical protein